MSTSLHVEILPEELVEIVDSVFTTMMCLPVTASDAPWFPDADRLTAVVYLTGVWNGAVLLECDHSLVRKLAGRFLSMDAPESVDDDVRDVFGELANMIGGNLKCVLTTGISLSMPSVVDGTDYSLRICKSEVQERISFQCEEGCFWVIVVGTHH